MDKPESSSTGASGWENVSFFCESSHQDMMLGDVKENPIFLILFPVAIVTSLMAILRVLLKPLGQVTFVSQILAGFVLGPSCLGQNKSLSEKLFSPKALLVLNVFETFGLIFSIFLISVRVDVSVIKKSGRLAIIIGLGTFFFPFVITIGSAHVLREVLILDKDLYEMLPLIASIESSTSFHSILSLLTNLKLLNSELGRLALSSSLISCLSSWFLLSVGSHIRDSALAGVKYAWMYQNLSIASSVIVIIFIFRPIMFWMMKQTPEGKQLKESHVVAINVFVIVVALFGEVTGHHSFLGPVILGMVTPVSPPLGPQLVQKIEHFIWAVCMPCYIVNVGRLVNLYSIEYNSFLAVESMIFISSTVKGIFDIQFYTRGYRLKIVNDECFSILVTHATLASATITPLVNAIYDSSRRYIAYRRRTIQHHIRHAELRILACIHESENVTTIINLLEASNPPRSPLAVYVVKLGDLSGHTLPIVQTHRLDALPSSKSTKVDQMVNAFRHYQQKGRGHVMVQCFTAAAPHATMHDEICLMAFEKNASLVIVPFQDTNNPFAKNAIKNVLKMAPCSVGVLFDRGIFLDPRSISSRRLKINVCVLFVGGPVDREALAYGARMAENQNILLTVTHLVPINHISTNLAEEANDFNMLNYFRTSMIQSQNVAYLERNIIEGKETTKLLRPIGNDFDLILVGVRHETDSPVLIGLSEWSEIEELGVIGDLLISSDFKGTASVMVIQQQASVVEGMIRSPKHNSKQNEMKFGQV